MNPTPIPLNDTAELIDWLDVRYPEASPRAPDEVPEALRRGAVRELIEDLRAELARYTGDTED